MRIGENRTTAQPLAVQGPSHLSHVRPLVAESGLFTRCDKVHGQLVPIHG